MRHEGTIRSSWRPGLWSKTVEPGAEAGKPRPPPSSSLRHRGLFLRHGTVLHQCISMLLTVTALETPGTSHWFAVGLSTSVRKTFCDRGVGALGKSVMETSLAIAQCSQGEQFSVGNTAHRVWCWVPVIAFIPQLSQNSVEFIDDQQEQELWEISCWFRLPILSNEQTDYQGKVSKHEHGHPPPRRKASQWQDVGYLSRVSHNSAPHWV